jgi:catechol 2,3-dioxygenase-like lactoylglutathione lyase family enzyme
VLGDHPINPVLLATDLAAAREFYHDRLGLEVLEENEAAIVLRCGGGTRLDVTKSTTGTADTQTQASWQVEDVRAEVAELRSRGVKVEDYDMPGLKTEDGIADLGFAWAAWIVDPGKNALGLLQLKQYAPPPRREGARWRPPARDRGWPRSAAYLDDLAICLGAAGDVVAAEDLGADHGGALFERLRSEILSADDDLLTRSGAAHSF